MIVRTATVFTIDISIFNHPVVQSRWRNVDTTGVCREKFFE